MNTKNDLVWREVHWPRPLPTEDLLELFHRIATEHTLGTVVIETRGNSHGTRFLLAAANVQIGMLTRFVTTLVPGAVLTKPTQPRRHVHSSRGLRLNHPTLALSNDRVTAVTRAVLAAFATASRDGDELVLQTVLGGRLSPRVLPSQIDDPRRSWFDLLTNGTTTAPAELRSTLKEHVAHHGFKTMLAIGVLANTPSHAASLAQNLFGALRVTETAGTRLRLVPDKTERFNQAGRPRTYPLRLPITELIAMMGLPIGDGPLPGMASVHPRRLAPAKNLPATKRVFATANSPGRTDTLGISAQDALLHTVMLGPTGSGKSTALLSLICADMAAGMGCLVIDPKADLVRDVLARIPAHRAGDVVVINPLDPSPVGLNPLIEAHRNPELIADTLLASFKSVFAETWGVRSEDVMSSALLTLARTPGANLVWLPALLTDSRFRAKILTGIDDPLGVDAFWAKYEAMKPAAQATLIAPTLNKLRQFLIRPAMRAVLGQSDPKFNLSELFTSNKIVLIALNKGILGPEAARLLGSLVVGQLWPLILRRGELPPQRRKIVSIYIDEVQDYLALPTDLADALSQSRSLGASFHLAHQYRRQLPESMKAAIDTNARNKITFGLNATDAADMARMAPDLEAADFMTLPRFGIYAHLMHQGESTGWVSADTLNAPAETGDPVDIKAASMARYGRPADQIDSDIKKAIGLIAPSGTAAADTTSVDQGAVGRRRR